MLELQSNPPFSVCGRLSSKSGQTALRPKELRRQNLENKAVVTRKREREVVGFLSFTVVVDSA